jgi:integrase
MHGRLARAGLVEPRRGSRLEAFLAGYVESRTDVSEGTRTNLRMWAHELAVFLGDVYLASVTPGHMDRFAAHLRTEHAPATAARRAKACRGFFTAARRQRLIVENPAEHLKGGSMANPTRQVFIGRETFARVLDAAPDAHWRLLLCLARFGALRVPSESSLLKWTDIAWDAARFTVTSPKTRRKAKPFRVVPLFPELAAVLSEAWGLAEDGAEFVLPGQRFRSAEKNLRKGVYAACARAGVEPWVKPFQNLRASRVTELAEEYPMHVVDEWCDHTEAVSRAHYRMTTEDHFARAAGVRGNGARAGEHASADS